LDGIIKDKPLAEALLMTCRPRGLLVEGAVLELEAPDWLDGARDATGDMAACRWFLLSSKGEKSRPPGASELHQTPKHIS